VRLDGPFRTADELEDDILLIVIATPTDLAAIIEWIHLQST
jgi:hypothetical protein